MLRDLIEPLKLFLKGGIEDLKVVLMPDFFLDRLISLKHDVETFPRIFREIVRRKGGCMNGIEQVEIRGGNAINTASALAALGVETTPIICTNKLGAQLIKFYTKPENTNLFHLKIFDKLSMTTAMEIDAEHGKVNVMLRDVGALADFGPHHLSGEDFEAIENADCVCLFNWAGTRNFGTELAKTVFDHVKTKGRGKTYYDTADPTPNKEKIQGLMKDVLKNKNVDVLSVNENEAICYASHLNNELQKPNGGLRLDELAKDAARVLASQLSARIDLHTTSFSATFTEKNETVVPAVQIPVLRTTGAGDAWNAGNIIGDFHSLPDANRLALANMVAAYYISNPDGNHPKREQLIEFCEKLKRNRP